MMTDIRSSAGTYSTADVTEKLDSPLIYSARHARMGITRTLTEVFVVGSYRYTNLPDAISQAKRDGAENE